MARFETDDSKLLRALAPEKRTAAVFYAQHLLHQIRGARLTPHESIDCSACLVRSASSANDPTKNDAGHI